MAEDLARHQAGLPVLVKPDSALYRLRKWVRSPRLLRLLRLLRLPRLSRTRRGLVWP